MSTWEISSGTWQGKEFFVYLCRHLIIQVAMRALGFDLRKPEVLQIIKENDRQGRKLINFEDFAQVSKYGKITVTYFPPVFLCFFFLFGPLPQLALILTPTSDC